jgi:hypothetical protein
MKRILVIALLLTTAAPALADVPQPSITGNSWVAIAIILGLVALIALFISGVLNISKGEKSSDDGAGIGVLDGIDDDDDEEDKKKH